MATTKENCLHRFCDMCCLESLWSTHHVQLESFGQHNEELVCDCCARFITYIGHLHGLGDEVTNFFLQWYRNQGGHCPPPPIFGRSINPIPTREGGDSAHPLLLIPPKLFIFRYHCKYWGNVFKFNCTNFLILISYCSSGERTNFMQIWEKNINDGNLVTW